jgi:hypothetical protein
MCSTIDLATTHGCPNLIASDTIVASHTAVLNSRSEARMFEMFFSMAGLRTVVLAFALLAVRLAPYEMARHTPGAPSAVIFNVDSILDEIDDDTSDGVCHSAANHCTLRAAIMQANRMTGPGVTINLPAGTYVLTRPPAGPDGDDSGNLNLTSPASGNPLITISGAGPDASIIDANQLDGVLQIDATRTAIISGVGIRNGYTADICGGINNNGKLTLSNSAIYNNQAYNGGGICNGDTLAISNSAIYGNRAANSGGGIVSVQYGTLTVSDSAIYGNHATTGSGGGISNSSFAGSLTVNNTTIRQNDAYTGGGGIYTDDNSALYVNNSAVYDNHATLGNGGGIYIALSSTVVLNNSTISHNVAYNAGGGVFIRKSSTVYVISSAIYSNTAQYGAGILNTGSLFVTNSTISQNDASEDGGGIYNSGTVNTYNATIAYNGADADVNYSGNGAGVFTGSGATFNLLNTLLAGNYIANSPTYNDCAGNVNIYGDNLFYTLDGCTPTIAATGSTFGLLNGLGYLGPLQDNGGATWTNALLRGSNAIDAGDHTFFGCIDANALPLVSDQRGQARVGGVRCDVGAFEYHAPVYLPLLRR